MRRDTRQNETRCGNNRRPEEEVRKDTVREMKKRKREGTRRRKYTIKEEIRGQNIMRRNEGTLVVFFFTSIMLLQISCLTLCLPLSH